MFPSDPKLTPLLRERQFLAAILVGLPGLLYAYIEAFRAVALGEAFDATGVTIALSANPITLYLVARQYPRGKAAEGIAAQLAPMPGPADPTLPADAQPSPEDVMEAQAALATAYEMDTDAPAGNDPMGVH